MSPRGYNSPVRQKAAAITREIILDAAVDLFFDRGYAATSIGDVAERADVSPNTVYAIFGNKAQLVLSLVNRVNEDPEIEAWVARAIAADSGAEVVETIAQGAGAIVVTQFKVFSVLTDSALAHHDIAENTQGALDFYRGRLRTVAERLAELGALRSEVSVDEAADVLWFLFGLTSWRKLHDLEWGPDRALAWLTRQAKFAVLAD
jgi:AcrR family transcriptional regulator